MSFLNADNLLKMAHDPALFREVINIEVKGSLVPLGSVLEPWQQADFEAMDGAFKAIAGRGPQVPVHSFWHERCRGSSKSQDLALQGLWTLLFARTQVLLVAAAGDRDQARIMRDSCDRLVRWNPWLTGGGKFIEVQDNRVINKQTGSELRIISSDAPTSYGLTCHAVLVDELSHWKKPDLWESLISTSAKKPGCVVVCLMNSGWTDHWVYPIRQAILDDPTWRFSRQDKPASWISKAELDRQRRLLPTVQYERLFENRWVLSSASAFGPEEVDRVVDLSAQELTQREPGWLYFAGLDLAVSRDDAALVVVGKHIGRSTEVRRPAAKVRGPMAALVDLGIVEGPQDEVTWDIERPTGKYKLAAVRIWRARGRKIDLTEVEREVLALHKRFKFRLAVDPFQAELLMQRCRQAGIPSRGVSFNPSSLEEMGAQLLDVVREQHLSLYPHEDLVADIKRLRVIEGPYKFKLAAERQRDDEPGTVHADAATALQIALHATSLFPASFAVGRRIVYN